MLLLWIGIGLLKGDDEDDELEGHSGLMAAIKTIVIADLVMSLDNVIGVAAAAKGSVVLLVVGLAISIPLIIYGSTLILKLMARFPVIITIGAGLLGWVAGEMAVTDPAITGWMHGQQMVHFLAPFACAALVVVVGKWMQSKSAGQAVAAAD